MKLRKITKSFLTAFGLFVLVVSFQNCAGNFDAASSGGSQSDLSSSGGRTLNAVLAWDKSTSANIAGYRIYVGVRPGDYDQVIETGVKASVAMPQYQIPDLDPSLTYYAVVKAYNTSGQESLASNEVEISPP
ncbi:MAG: hypothetical protein ACAH59_08600 [Pseudobdellovibrionaceae bacterium]